MTPGDAFVKLEIACEPGCSVPEVTMLVQVRKNFERVQLCPADRHADAARTVQLSALKAVPSSASESSWSLSLRILWSAGMTKKNALPLLDDALVQTVYQQSSHHASLIGDHRRVCARADR